MSTDTRKPFPLGIPTRVTAERRKRAEALATAQLTLDRFRYMPHTYPDGSRSPPVQRPFKPDDYLVKTDGREVGRITGTGYGIARAALEERRDLNAADDLAQRLAEANARMDTLEAQLAAMRQPEAKWFSGYDVLPVAAEDVLSPAEFSFQALPVQVENLAPAPSDAQREAILALVQKRVAETQKVFLAALAGAQTEDSRGKGLASLLAIPKPVLKGPPMRTHARPLFLAVFVCLASLFFGPTGAQTVAVRGGPWVLYSGASEVDSFAREEACISAAAGKGDGRYSCRHVIAIGVSGSQACGPDIGGWSNPQPTPADTTSYALTHKAQPGTRLHYISAATGDDKTGKLYFWNGQAIIDDQGHPANAQGLAYGTDPARPSAAVKAFKRWAYVAPRRDPNHDIGSKGEISQWPAFRFGFPDWYLFARGETFDLKQDLDSFAAETGANATYGSLALAGGANEVQRQVMTAYGDPCLARPRFVHEKYHFIYRADREGMPGIQHVLYQSLHFDAHDRSTGQGARGVSFSAQTLASVDIVLEDVWIDGVGLGINPDNGGRYLIRRSLITDSWIDDGTHVQGIYYEGAPGGVLRIEDSYLLRNGFSHGDPKVTGWPPAGAQVFDRFNRNMYINGEYDPLRSGLFDSVSMIGASGDQWRTGGRIARNFFYQGYVDVGARGGYPDADGPTTEIFDNVLQRFIGTGTNDNTGQPGWGMTLSAGSAWANVRGNIVTGAQHKAAYYGLQLSPINQDCYAAPKHPTRANTVRGNIFDSGSAKAAIRVTDGTTLACFVDLLMAPGVTGNAVQDNTLINDTAGEWEYLPTGNAPATTDTHFAGNRVYKTRAEAAAAEGWPAPERTLQTYLVSQGVHVDSADGFPEFFALATQQRRGKWLPQWTASRLINHVREGFKLPPLTRGP